MVLHLPHQPPTIYMSYIYMSYKTTTTNNLSIMTIEANPTIISLNVLSQYDTRKDWAQRFVPFRGGTSDLVMLVGEHLQ